MSAGRLYFNAPTLWRSEVLNSFGSLASTCRQLTLPEPAESRVEGVGDTASPVSLANRISSSCSSRSSLSRAEILPRRSASGGRARRLNLRKGEGLVRSIVFSLALSFPYY